MKLLDPRLDYPDCTDCGALGTIHTTVTKHGWYCLSCGETFVPPHKWRGIEKVDKKYRKAWVAVEIQGYPYEDFAHGRRFDGNKVKRMVKKAEEQAKEARNQPDRRLKQAAQD